MTPPESTQQEQLKEKDVLIIDYDIGNLLSITNALDFLGYTYIISNKVSDIIAAKAYILPGVGAFNEAMQNLNNLQIIPTLTQEVVIKKKPLLGICLGMQILAQSSTENGNHQGLGWIPGKVIKIPQAGNLKVPQVGWNTLTITIKDPLFSRVPDSPHFYFDHSYHFLSDAEFIAATCQYGSTITAAVRKENIFGVQFHPEKSQNNGLKMYRSFFNYIKQTTLEQNTP